MIYHPNVRDPLSNQEELPLQQSQLGISRHSSSQSSSQGDVHHSQSNPQSQDSFASSSQVQQAIVYRDAVPMNTQMSTDSNTTNYTYYSMPNPHFASGSSTNYSKGSSSLYKAALIEEKIKNNFGFYTCMLFAYAAFFIYNVGSVIINKTLVVIIVEELGILGSFILGSMILVGLCVIAIKAKLNLNAKLQYWTYISLYVFSVFVLLGTLIIFPWTIIIQPTHAREGMFARMAILVLVVFYVLNFVLVYYARNISKLMEERSHLLNNSSHSQSSQNVSSENLLLEEAEEAASIEQRMSRNFDCYPYHNMPNPESASMGTEFQQGSTNQTPGSSTSHSKYTLVLNQAILMVLKIKSDFGFYTCIFYTFAVVVALGVVALVLKFLEKRYINIEIVPAVALSWLAICVIAIKAKANLNPKLRYWTYIVQCIWSVFVLVFCLAFLFLMIEKSFRQIRPTHYHYTHHQDNDSVFSVLVKMTESILVAIVLNALNFVLAYYTRASSKLMDERSRFLDDSSHFESSQNIGSKNLLLKKTASIEQRISRNFDCYTCLVCFQTIWYVLDFIMWIADGKVSKLISLLYIGGGILALKAKSSFSSKQQLYVFILLCIKATYVLLYQTISSPLDIIGELKYILYYEREFDDPSKHFFVPVILIVCFQVLTNPLLIYYGYRLRKLMRERDHFLNEAKSI